MKEVNFKMAVSSRNVDIVKSTIELIILWLRACGVNIKLTQSIHYSDGILYFTGGVEEKEKHGS